MRLMLGTGARTSLIPYLRLVLVLLYLYLLYLDPPDEVDVGDKRQDQLGTIA
jgi:hypothetical protein